MSDGTSCWRESFGSEEQLKAFLRGVQCGCAMNGNFDLELDVDHERNVQDIRSLLNG